MKEQDFDVENFLYVLRPYYKGGEFAVVGLYSNDFGESEFTGMGL